MALVDETYLYLPSSSPSTVVENTISHFTTTLNAPVQLVPGLEYEAALVKAFYPASVNNVFDGTFKYFSYGLTRMVLSRVPDGFYDLPRGFSQEFRKAFTEADRAHYRISGNKSTRRYTMDTRNLNLVRNLPYLKLSGNLQALTGLPEVINKNGVTAAEQPWNLLSTLNNIYCYTDIVSNCIIGTTKAPIIAVFNYEGGSSNASQIQYEPRNPVYMPVSKNVFNEIRVEFRTKTGEYFPFTSGETMVIFHVRPKKYK